LEEERRKEDKSPDYDIEDDLKYIDLFGENLRDRGADEPPPTRPQPNR